MSNCFQRGGQTAMAFFEIRQYTVRPGKMKEWLDFMERVIIPFQTEQGMTICANFHGEEDDSVYIWIRRFESESQRKKLYALVYESEYWTKEVAPQVVELIDRDLIVVQRVLATETSGVQ